MSRATQAEITAFIDSIPDTFINRQQRVLALMTYEEIKRRNPAVSNYGRPLWPATHTKPLRLSGAMHLSLTPIVVSQDGQVEATAFLAVETDSAECRYWVFTPMAPDSLQSASDRDGEVADDFNSCMQDCLCPSPAGNPHWFEYIKCFVKCFSTGNAGQGSIWITVGGIQLSGFVNRGSTYGTYTNNGSNGNNNNNGNGSLPNYNFNQTAYNVFDKYYDCLSEHSEISTAVWNKLYTPNGTAHCLAPLLDEALGMVCEEAQGINITVADWEEEFVRAIEHFYNIVRNIEGYVFPACGLVGDVINFALQHRLTSEQFAAFSLTEILNSIQNAIESGNISPETGKRIFDAAMAFGATIDQVNFLIQLAQQNPSIDFLEALIVNFAFSAFPPPTNPPISVNKLACPYLFSFGIEDDNDLNPQNPPAPNRWKSAVAALDEVYLEFNYQGATKQEKINCIGFVISNKGGGTGCLDMSAEFAASILNIMVSRTQNDVMGFSSGLTDAQFSQLVRSRIRSNLIAAAQQVSSNSGCTNYQFIANMHASHVVFLRLYDQDDSTNCDTLMANCP